MDMAALEGVVVLRICGAADHAEPLGAHGSRMLANERK
jgi:hypothetical protein